jgi:hypothetical protein
MDTKALRPILFAFLIASVTAARADTEEEVSFQAAPEYYPFTPVPGGPVPVAIYGNFFFNTTLQAADCALYFRCRAPLRVRRGLHKCSLRLGRAVL